MWLDWLVFCDGGFQSVCPLMEKDKRLMEASWWERLTEGKTGFCSDGYRAMLSKSLIQFSVDGWGCVPSLLFDLRPNCGGGNEANGTSCKGPMHALLCGVTLTLQQAIADPRLCRRLLETHRQVWVSLFWGHCPFLLSPDEHRFCLCPSTICFPSSV